MKITRVVYEKDKSNGSKALAVCAIVLDDCLKLNGIRLFNGERGYYLILPSKQDIYKDIVDFNPGVNIKIPAHTEESTEVPKKKYDEFFHPVDACFYREILNIVIVGYEEYKSQETDFYSYKPKN